jgi:hypothetical protein
MTETKGAAAPGRGARARNVFLVTLYMLGALVVLLARRRIGSVGLARWLASFLRPSIKMQLRDVEHESGYCFTAKCSRLASSDAEGVSPFVLLEDGRPLPIGHCGHSEIRSLGAGRYSHWKDRIYFSTSDNSDPAVNGRQYVAVEVRW